MEPGKFTPRARVPRRVGCVAMAVGTSGGDQRGERGRRGERDGSVSVIAIFYQSAKGMF
jgi:hypothetical protein